jgi:hypothetical protein
MKPVLMGALLLTALLHAAFAGAEGGNITQTDVTLRQRSKTNGSAVANINLAVAYTRGNKPSIASRRSLLHPAAAPPSGRYALPREDFAPATKPPFTSARRVIFLSMIMTL